MQEGTTSRVTATDRPYGEFYDFYVSPENVRFTLVHNAFTDIRHTVVMPNSVFQYSGTPIQASDITHFLVRR
jgi:hypothetical protein